MASSKLGKDQLHTIFKESMQKVCKILKKQPHEVDRNTYRVVSRFLPSSQRLHNDNFDDLGGYKVLVKDVFLEEKQIEATNNKPNPTQPITEKEILKHLSNYIKENHKIPTWQEYIQKTQLNDKVVKQYFNTVQDMYKKVIKLDKTVNNYVFNETSFTSTEYITKVNELIKKYSKFVITTAVSGKKIHEGFFNALKNYSERENALILILPCQDVISRKTTFEWELDARLRDIGYVIHRDTYLNNNIFISDIKVSAKMLIPITGLSRLAQKKGSTIVASPKQFLEYLPTSNRKTPTAMMSTGAITENNYNTEFYMSMRLSKIASIDHVVGAIVVEKQDDNIFHFRQLQVSDNNSICDLYTEYFSDGTIRRTTGTTIVLGDSHAVVKDEEVFNKAKELISTLNPDNVVVHDISDFECISHHIKNDIVANTLNYESDFNSIEKEGEEISSYINDLTELVENEVVVVRSNHDTHLDRYLSEGRFVKDRVNFRYSLDICAKYLDGEIPLKHLIVNKIGLNQPEKVRWLNYHDSYKVEDVELANHGHLGSNGARGSAQNIEKCYTKSVIGHSHTPLIRRGVYQCGTLSRLVLNYTKTPSSWLHTLAIVYSNGTRTLVSFIKDNNNEYQYRSNK